MQIPASDNLKKEGENNNDPAGQKEDKQHKVLNPFEDDIKAADKEALENIEQFKEAQTERD